MVNQKQYAAKIQYVPQMEGSYVLWSWQAEIIELDQSEVAKTEVAVNSLYLSSETSWADKSAAAKSARDTIEAYLHAQNEENREQVLFTL